MYIVKELFSLLRLFCIAPGMDLGLMRRHHFNSSKVTGAGVTGLVADLGGIVLFGAFISLELKVILAEKIVGPGVILATVVATVEGVTLATVEVIVLVGGSLGRVGHTLTGEIAEVIAALSVIRGLLLGRVELKLTGEIVVVIAVLSVSRVLLGRVRHVLTSKTAVEIELRSVIRGLLLGCVRHVLTTKIAVETALSENRSFAVIAPTKVVLVVGREIPEVIVVLFIILKTGEFVEHVAEERIELGVFLDVNSISAISSNEHVELIISTETIEFFIFNFITEISVFDVELIGEHNIDIGSLHVEGQFLLINDEVEGGTSVNTALEILEDRVLNGLIGDLGNEGSLGSLRDTYVVGLVDFANILSSLFHELLNLFGGLGNVRLGLDDVGGRLVGVIHDLLDQILLVVLSFLDQHSLNLGVVIGDGLKASLNLSKNGIRLILVGRNSNEI